MGWFCNRSVFWSKAQSQPPRRMRRYQRVWAYVHLLHAYTRTAYHIPIPPIIGGDGCPLTDPPPVYLYEFNIVPSDCISMKAAQIERICLKYFITNALYICLVAHI